jgi:hypothetical protein
VRPDELPAYWERIRRRVGDEGPQAAAYAMAKAYHAEVVDVDLVKSSHSAGTRTPAPAGGPPAAVTGSLRRSVRLYPAVRTGSYKARSNVKPLIKYARIQETGGTVTALHTYVDKKGNVQRGYLRWGSGASTHFAKSVKIPARPYMHPAHVRMVQDGRLRNAAAQSVDGLVS